MPVLRGPANPCRLAGEATAGRVSPRGGPSVLASIPLVPNTKVKTREDLAEEVRNE